MAAAAVSVARKLGAGGEAEVFELSRDRRLAFKRYRQPDRARTAKLRVMVAHPPEGIDDGGHVAIAWPMGVVEGPGGVAAGFTMPRIDTASTVPLFQVYNPQSRRQVAPGFSWRYLVRTARNVAAIVDAVHRAGYVIGDLNESNFLVSKRALVTLVDCDSLQVTDPATGEVHGCPVGKPEFLAPELQRADLSTTARTEASDRFALAVLLHLILLEGAHPFAGIWRGRGDPPDIGTRIARRAAAHHRRGPVDPAPFALELGVVPHDLRRLFVRAFGAGLRRPRVRPSAADWLAALDAAEVALVDCPRSPHHVHAGHLRRCPWCDRLRRGLPDPFPGPGGGAGLAPPPPTLVERAAEATRRAQRAAAGSVAAAGRRAGAAVGSTVAGAARSAWTRSADALGPPLVTSVPVRFAAAVTGLFGPVLVAVIVAVLLLARSGAVAAPGPWPRIRRFRNRWAGDRPSRHAGRLALAVPLIAGLVAGLIAVAMAGLDGGASFRAAIAVAAASAVRPLPLVARPGPKQRRLTAGPIHRWWPAALWALGGAGMVVFGPMAVRPALTWPLGDLVRLVVAATG